MAFWDEVKILFQDSVLLAIFVSPDAVASLLAVSVPLGLHAVVLVGVSAFVFTIIVLLYLTPYFKE